MESLVLKRIRRLDAAQRIVACQTNHKGEAGATLTAVQFPGVSCYSLLVSSERRTHEDLTLPIVFVPTPLIIAATETKNSQHHVSNPMTKKLLILALLAVTPTALIAQTQQQPSPESKLIQFQMAILKRGPKWGASPDTSSVVHKQHLEYVRSLLSSGKAVIAGPIRDDSDFAGVYIFRTQSPEEAKSWVMADPAVVAQHVVPELHPWWSEDVMKKTETPEKMMTAYLAFLVRGDKWTPEQTPQTQEIQKAHLANIGRLAEMKKLVVAGPFGDNGNLRGIFVFRVNSLEEARALTLTDPAVQAGRLALDLHPWLIPEGILP
jgi:uncharacterized protein YciI